MKRMTILFALFIFGLLYNRLFNRNRPRLTAAGVPDR